VRECQLDDLLSVPNRQPISGEQPFQIRERLRRRNGSGIAADSRLNLVSVSPPALAFCSMLFATCQTLFATKDMRN
jgi:hypothetical protein